MNQGRMLVTSKKQMLGLRILGVVILIVSVIVCIVRVQENQRIADERNHCIQCTAVVKEMLTSRFSDDDGTLNYRVIVTYTVDGKNYENRVVLSNGNIKKGDRVSVWYDPDDPSHLAEDPDSWNRTEPIVNSIIVAVVGVVFIIISLFSMDGSYILFAGRPVKKLSY